MARKIGYARVSALHQSRLPDRCPQGRAVRSHLSGEGVRQVHRPELEKAIDALGIGDILVSEIAPPPLTPALLQLREPPAQWVECHHNDGPHNIDPIQ